MTTFWEKAAHSVDHIFSMYFEYFVILLISRFGLTSVPDLCIRFTFSIAKTYELISTGAKSVANIVTKSNRRAMNRNWSHQKANPALKIKWELQTN